MKILNFILVIFLLCGSHELRAQNDTSERFVLLEYGFPPSQDFLDIRTTVSKKWNIVNKPVAGCMVTQRLEDSVRIFNEATFQKLSARYGEDWEVQYNTELNSAIEVHVKMANEVKLKPFVRENENQKETISRTADRSRMTIQIASEETTNSHNGITAIRNLNDDAKDLIYRGFPNLFEIQFGGISEQSDYELECINCELRTDDFSDTLPINQFIIKPKGSSKECILNIHSSDGVTTSYPFRVQSLPDPEIYLNGTRSGETIDLSTLDSTMSLALKYDDGITLRAEFTVQDWGLNSSKNSEQKTIGSGSGNMIPKKYTDQLKGCEPGTTLSFICTVNGPDGILRKKSASFVVQR